MSRKKTKRLKQKIIHSIIIILLYFFLTTVSIVQYSKIDEKRQADTGIILGAGSANGKVSPVFQERINHGIWLYQNGYIKQLIFTGGRGNGQSISDARSAMQYAVSSGVPSSVISIEETSAITQENIQNAKKIMDNHGWKTAIIISDPLHMKRAMLMAEDYKLTAYSSPTPSSKYISWKTKLPFLLRETFFFIGYQWYRLIPFNFFVHK